VVAHSLEILIAALWVAGGEFAAPITAATIPIPLPVASATPATAITALPLRLLIPALADWRFNFHHGCWFRF
jgi:hypothetical protein